MKFTKVLLATFASRALGHVTEQQQRDLSLSRTECTVSTLHGMPLPGEDEIEPTYVCTTDEGVPLFFDEDPSPLIDPHSYEPGSTRFSIEPHNVSPDGKISVRGAMTRGALEVSKIAGMDLSRQKGTKNVLVIIVKNSSDAPTQDAAKMYNDVFTDENNLKVRYNDCSNGQLIMQPATGNQVVNGVLTVTTTQTLNGVSYSTCGSIGINQANALGISRDYTMIVCPNTVSFNGAAAYGQMPGSVSWYLSSYASAPIVQMHELGHNLGHHHSGKNGVTYADPTCNMGNQGSWSDTGSNFCWNAAKTWSTTWYEDYHVTVNPTNTGFDGTVVGINAVIDNDIGNNEKVVMKITSSGETNLFLMYTRQVGAMSGIPQDGNKIVIVSQGGSYSTTSSWEAALTEGQTYTQSNWSGAGTLTVKVCELDTTGTGSARVIVYATGIETKTCAPPEPTISPAPTPDATTCVDDPEGWYDSYGTAYTCDWYASNESYCGAFGDYFENFGKTANEACCVCGGGKKGGGGAPTAPTSPVAQPTQPPVTSPVAQPTQPPVTSPTDGPTQPDASTCPSNPNKSSCLQDCGCRWKGTKGCLDSNIGLYGCSGITKRNLCKKYAHCKWNKNKSLCKVNFNKGCTQDDFA